ncbi:MAG: hypothetical protein HUJ68_12550 [Clostridia bacterium]|nr:hypothetical protein [Clostridia bacterium]
MDTFVRFLYEFVNQTISGVALIATGLWNGLKQIFNIPGYIEIIRGYYADFTGPEWVLAIIAIAFVGAFLGLSVFLLGFIIRKYAKFRKPVTNQEELLDEIATLNKKVVKLSKEKDEILAMKVSQLGLKPDEPDTIEADKEEKEPEEQPGEMGQRFSKLSLIDMEYANYKPQNYGNTFDLQELCYMFRNFAASKLKLYYKEKMIRIFIAGLASTRLVILQGISGTGKTSLAYAWGKFLKHDSYIASVQPSWRDRTDIFGYFNEFTKKFNETDVLKEMYIANHTDDVYTVILDEMNLSRVEYYFAEMLSILEMPNKKEWIIEVVPNYWPTDPKKLMHGKIQVPANMWYIGTINNDDSTFAVTDKVYDRAMPIDINDKGQVFEPDEVDAQDINYSYMDKVFSDAMQTYAISKETLDKIEKMDDYVITHFRIAFGNRIVSHMKKFVPVYVGCGGTEVEGVDYFIAKKILRKFEQLNMALIKDEIDPYIDFLNKTFGKNAMAECIEYLQRLKKSA